ncbi:MAG: IPT/TIG domain-containing protein, partial [Solirubrobacteraceae bacterium]
EVTVKDPAHAAGTVDVTVKTSAGTSTTSNSDHFTYQAPAPPPPALPVVTSVTPGEGPEAGGTTVTIKGQHFEGATEAKFGSTTATELKVVGGTEITVKDPAHTPGTVDVTVKTSAGTSTTSNTDHFIYQAAQVTPPETTPEAKLRALLQEVRSSNIQHQIHNELSCLLSDALRSFGGLSGYRHSSRCETGRISRAATAKKADRRKSTQLACEDLEQFAEVIRDDQHRNRPKIPAKLATAWAQAANGIEASLGCTRHGRQSSRKPSPPVHGQHGGHRSGGR